MRVTCPNCKTTYEMASKIPDKSVATIVCAVCKTQLDVQPGSLKTLYRPVVTIRPIQEG